MLFSCIALHCIVVQLIKRTHSRSARLECILLLLRRAWIWCTRCPGAKNVKPSSSKCQFAEIKLTRFWKAQIKLHPSHLSMSWRCSAPSFLFGREFMIILSKHASKSKFLGQMRIKNNWFGKVSESYTVIHCSALHMTLNRYHTHHLSRGARPSRLGEAWSDTIWYDMIVIQLVPKNLRKVAPNSLIWTLLWQPWAFNSFDMTQCLQRAWHNEKSLLF